MQVNPNGKVQLIIIDIPKNLHVLMVAMNAFDIPPWNQMVDKYIVFVFDFVDKFWPLMIFCYCLT